MPARYARRSGWLFIIPPYKCPKMPLKVIRERGNKRREKNRRSARNRKQRPVKPRHANRRLLEPPQHVRPKIAAKFSPDRRQGVAQLLANVGKLAALRRIVPGLLRALFFAFLHECTPNRCNFFRSNR